MELNIEQRKRVAQLYDAYLALPEAERLAWLDGLTGDDANLRPPLLELLADRDEVLRGNFLELPSSTEARKLRSDPEKTAVVARSLPLTDPSPTEVSEKEPPTPNLRPAVGMTLGDRFELLESLGEGGMGQVFKARDRIGDDRDPFVAVKVINDNIKRFAGADAALRRETQRARLVPGPNVVNVREFYIDERYGFAFMTMEYLRGQPLSGLISTEGKEGLPFARAWPIIDSIGRALANGHTCTWEDERGIQTGIVHRDLKPANVFVCHDGRVKVLDFGIARVMPTPASKGETTLFGKGFRILTLEYASLEMLKGDAPPDPRDDIYAYGCITYELLTGRHPFAQASADQALKGKLKPQRPAQLDRRQWRALRQALAFRRADRMPSATRFLLEFAPRRWIRKHAMPLVAAALVAFVGALAYAYYYMVVEPGEMGEPVPAHVALNPQQQTALNDLVARARDRLEDVDITTGPEQLSYVLSDGLDSVNELTNDALEIQPDSQDARKIRAQAAALYAAKARQVLQQRGPPATAFRLIERGLKTRRNDRTLLRMRKEVCEQNAGACGNTSS
jgi:serine/threonine protein kinase